MQLHGLEKLLHGGELLRGPRLLDVKFLWVRGAMRTSSSSIIDVANQQPNGTPGVFQNDAPAHTRAAGLTKTISLDTEMEHSLDSCAPLRQETSFALASCEGNCPKEGPRRVSSFKSTRA